QNDVGSDIVVDDLRSGEGTCREQLVVDFDGASSLHTLPGWFFLLALLGTFIRFLASRDETADGRRRRRRAHRTTRSTGTKSGTSARSAHSHSGTTRTCAAGTGRTSCHRTRAGTAGTRGATRTRGTRTHWRACSARGHS